MENEITETMEEKEFSAENFINVIEKVVNSFSCNYEKTAQELAKMDDEKQILLQETINSCFYTLAHIDWIDGRNEIASEVCRKLNPKESPMPEVGECFIRMHPTLQQSACRLFCCYLEKTEIAEYQTSIDELKSERGNKWYYFPLI